MKKYPITFKDFGQSAILVEWPNEVSEEILEDIIQYKTTLCLLYTSPSPRDRG